MKNTPRKITKGQTFNHRDGMAELQKFETTPRKTHKPFDPCRCGTCVECLNTPRKATHTPWHILNHDRSFEVVNSLEETVFDDGSAWDEYEQKCSPETAALIVHRVNMFDELLETLTLTKKMLAELRRTMDDGHWFADDLTRIDKLAANTLARASSEDSK